MAAIFDYSRWPPCMRSNMADNATCHLYANFQISKFCEFSNVRSPPSPSLHVNYRVREPHVSHTGINVYAHCPLHLPKIVTEKPSVNHIGSSTSHQLWKNSITVVQMSFSLSHLNVDHFGSKSQVDLPYITH